MSTSSLSLNATPYKHRKVRRMTEPISTEQALALLDEALAHLMTPADVAAEYNIDERNVRRACTSGRLPCREIAGSETRPGLYLIPRAAVHEMWTDYHRQTGALGKTKRSRGNPTFGKQSGDG